MYNKIYDFCKVRNKGGVYSNTHEPTPRVQFILNLLESEGIEYELDAFPLYVRYPSLLGLFGKSEKEKEEQNQPKAFNIVMRGSSNRMVIAHHDVARADNDNANDNSASVINAIMIKKLRPEINVVITDGEEVGGLGSQRLSNRIKIGDFGKIDWILNLELTGKGGKYFFIGDYPGKLQDHIKSLFNCPVISTPYNDSVTIKSNGIDSVVINPVPPLKNGKKSKVEWIEEDGTITYLDYSMVYNCHSDKDNVNSIDPKDMQEFVEQVAMKILS
jgi:hypothetical protein